MQIEMTVVSKMENPPSGDRTFTRYIVALQPVGGTALLELTFDNKAEADEYVIGETKNITVG